MFECGSFFLPIGGPISYISLGAVGIEVEISEEKFQPAISDERIAFEVEKDVAWRGFRKTGEAKSGEWRQGLVHDRPLRPSLDLNSGLLTDLLITSSGTPIGPPLKGQRHRCERCSSRDAVSHQLSDLGFADACD